MSGRKARYRYACGKVTSKTSAIKRLSSVSRSCQEGYDGTWDCHTDEGKDGFLAMQLCVDDVIAWLRRRK